MAAIPDAFRVQIASYGSGWKGISVALGDSWRPASLVEHKGVFCLTLETTTPQEFERDVDELIDQLIKLKLVGCRKLRPLSTDQG